MSGSELAAVRAPARRLPLPRALRRPARRMLTHVARAQEETRLWRQIGASVVKVQPYTMVAEAELTVLARQVLAVLAEGTPGSFVECGVWRGGTAFLMADLLRRARAANRKVWLCDSFEGLPPPSDIDGAGALAYAADTASPYYYDNCTAALEDVQRTAAALGLSAYTECVRGWFDQSLPLNRERFGPIALLRIDADWYDSVSCCLDQLYDQVVPGGIVAFDDYYAWDGCAVAVHEFLGRRRLAHRLQVDSRTVYFRKE